MKKIAIIGAGQAAVDYAISAKKMGVETYCFAWRRGAIAAEVVDYYYDISIFEKEKIVDICKNVGIDGVVATTELTIYIAAYIAEKLQLNGIPLEVAGVITDKFRNRKVTKSVRGLHHPRYAKVMTAKEIKELGFSFPLIIKPTDKGGKRGVSVVESPEEIENSVQYLREDVGGKSPIIVEEYIEGGSEYSVESLSFHGNHSIIQVTEKISSGPPHCAELGHIQPANLSNQMRKKVEDIIGRALDALGIENGPCHTEIKIVNDTVYLIEFNARPGGDLISGTLTELSTGYPYFQGMIDVALNIKPEYKIKTQRYAGVFFITEQTSRKIKDTFDICQKYDWCYCKHEIAEPLKTIVHNDSRSSNYFIYYSEKEPCFI